MKKMQMMITDLHYDLLKIIIPFMAKSSGGAADLARAISVCRDFMKFADDEDVLRAANFDNVGPLDHYESYQCMNGLITKCAQAGTVSAQYMLAKVILVSSSQMWERASKDFIYYFARYLPINQASRSSRDAEKDIRASFMAHFMVDQASTSNRSDGGLIHSELVRLFVCQCNPVDLVTMHSYLVNYFKYFVGAGGIGYLKFFDNINAMSGILRSVVNLGKIRKVWYTQQKLRGIPTESGKGKRESNAPSVDKAERLFHFLLNHRELVFKRAIDQQIHAPSGSILEVLKRECKVITEQLIPLELGNGEREANAEFTDVGERFFYYIVEHRLTSTAAEILGTTAASVYDLGYLRRECREMGKEYESYRLNATLAFDDICPRKGGV